VAGEPVGRGRCCRLVVAVVVGVYGVGPGVGEVAGGQDGDDERVEVLGGAVPSVGEVDG